LLVQVLVQVHYAGINGGCETFRARGEYAFASNTAKQDFPLGAEGCGVVVAVGAEVTNLKVGGHQGGQSFWVPLGPVVVSSRVNTCRCNLVCYRLWFWFCLKLLYLTAVGYVHPEAPMLGEDVSFCKFTLADGIALVKQSMGAGMWKTKENERVYPAWAANGPRPKSLA
jgi:hypothetical protein